MEGSRAGGFGLEGFGPGSLEMEGIDEHETGVGGEQTGRDEIGDPGLGLTFYPLIDVSGGGRGGVDEVEGFERGAIGVGGEVEEGLEDWVTDLAEQTVGDVEGNGIGGRWVLSGSGAGIGRKRGGGRSGDGIEGETE